MKYILTAAAVLVASTSIAHAHHYPRSDHFKHEATGYIVHSRSSGDTLILSGRHPVTGATFKVKATEAGRITGTWEGRRIDFVMQEKPDAVQSATVAQIMGSPR